jgi:hypothetical protein
MDPVMIMPDRGAGTEGALPSWLGFWEVSGRGSKGSWGFHTAAKARRMGLRVR